MKEQLGNPEKDNGLKDSLPFIIIRPGGNDTCLFIGKTPVPTERKRWNEIMLRLYPNVEQVGFIDSNFNRPKFTMAGGEFCGNGTRSAAFLLLGGQPGELLIETSGVKERLRTGIKENGESFAQMPVYSEIEKITREDNAYVVEMEGITHIVTFDTEKIAGLNPEAIKVQAMEVLQAKGFDQKYPAAGVIYVQRNGEGLKIHPVVYVRDVNTVYYETACGSRTAALGLVLALENSRSIRQVPIEQPSGINIKISVEYDTTKKKFTYAEIQGPINVLANGVLETVKEESYVLDQIVSSDQLEQAFGLGLIESYKQAFGGPPYYENFDGKEENIKEDFRYYFGKGIVCTAKTGNGVAGFAAAIPLTEERKIVDLLSKTSIDADNYWYIAELGIRNDLQRKGLGRRLMDELLLYLPIGKNYVLRTSVDNYKAISLYQSLGFTQLEEVLQDVEQLRTDGTTQKDTRLFLVKK